MGMSSDLELAVSPSYHVQKPENTENPNDIYAYISVQDTKNKQNKPNKDLTGQILEFNLTESRLVRGVIFRGLGGEYKKIGSPQTLGSPKECISINREGLESEYVSSNFHHWIDLVFSYKQRGKPVVEAANILYYLTYEGGFDWETMEDELEKSAISEQITNFGQIPIQLFWKKHPRKNYLLAKTELRLHLGRK